MAGARNDLLPAPHKYVAVLDLRFNVSIEKLLRDGIGNKDVEDVFDDCRHVPVKAFRNAEVAEVFKSYPKRMRTRLMVLRHLIFDTAAATEGVGELEETLKRGEPAYLTTASKSGSTIRIAWKKPDASRYAMYFNCQTNLLETFKTLFPKDFTFGGNRSIVFSEHDDVPIEELSACIAIALTYHRDKRSDVFR